MVGVLRHDAQRAALASPAEARNPPNPYSSFNLSGINYGSMQWETGDASDGSGGLGGACAVAASVLWMRLFPALRDRDRIAG